MQKKQVYLHKIATVVPDHFYTQEFALQFLLKLQGDSEKKRDFLTRIYQGTAIDKRHSVITDYGKDPGEHVFFPKNETLEPEPSTEERNDLYIQEAPSLALSAVEKLLKKLNQVDKSQITHIITVSCTGFAAPGIDFYIARELELSPYVNRYHIGFMGCYAAFPALKLARNICLSEPDARVLVVNIELCSIHFQKKFDLETVVAMAIFSDGISAALVSAHPRDSNDDKIILHDFHSYLIADSENDMAWKIGKHGFDMKLSAYVPTLIQQNIKKILNQLFKQNNLNMDKIDIWAVHPGGRSILEKLEKELSIMKERFLFSYQVLKEYGNMSSTTIMFVLDKILQSGQEGNIFSVAFGPGLTVESGYMEKTR